MKKWEYVIVDSGDVAEDGNFLTGKSREAVESYLNELGAQGWEIVNLDFLELEHRTSFVGIAKRKR